jgi:5'-nucleotidase
MEILITNDDGIYAEGIFALYDSLRKTARVTVVAPDTQRSAVGHAITLADPLRVTEVRRYGRFFGYATSGTPADCVKLAIRAIMKKKPDLVFSGINLGANMGYNVLYSGTVSGATEGALLGIPSVAISLATFIKPDFSCAAAFARKIAAAAAAGRLPPGALLNVNVPAVPAGRIKGVSITRQSRTLFNDRFDKRTDPHGQTYYWLTGSLNQKDASPDSDLSALRRNRVSITPLQFDLTDYKFLKELAGWKFRAPKRR